MKKPLILLFCLFIGFNGFAQDWKTKLQEEIVTISNNQYVAKEFQAIKFKNGASLEFKITANGQTAAISRDFFLSTYNTLGLFTMVGVVQELGQTLDDVEFEDVEEADANPDITLDFNMTSTGIIWSVITADGTEKTEMTWEDFFADN